MKYLCLSLTFALVGLAPATTFAQGLVFDSAALSATCVRTPRTCRAAVQQVIVQLKAAGLTPAELNSQLGSVAAAVVEAVVSASNGSNNADAAQSAAITSAATQIESGSTRGLEGGGTAFGASPA